MLLPRAQQRTRPPQQKAGATAVRHPAICSLYAWTAPSIEALLFLLLPPGASHPVSPEAGGDIFIKDSAAAATILIERQTAAVAAAAAAPATAEPPPCYCSLGSNRQTEKERPLRRCHSSDTRSSSRLVAACSVDNNINSSNNNLNNININNNRGLKELWPHEDEQRKARHTLNPRRAALRAAGLRPSLPLCFHSGM